jgi:hypothetical protein
MSLDIQGLEFYYTIPEMPLVRSFNSLRSNSSVKGVYLTAFFHFLGLKW